MLYQFLTELCLIAAGLAKERCGLGLKVRNQVFSRESVMIRKENPPVKQG
jgi:hypothetical protein